MAKFKDLLIATEYCFAVKYGAVKILYVILFIASLCIVCKTSYVVILQSKLNVLFVFLVRLRVMYVFLKKKIYILYNNFHL